MLGYYGVCPTGIHIPTSFESGAIGERNKTEMGHYIVGNRSEECLNHSGWGKEENC